MKMKFIIILMFLFSFGSFGMSDLDKDKALLNMEKMREANKIHEAKKLKFMKMKDELLQKLEDRKNSKLKSKK